MGVRQAIWRSVGVEDDSAQLRLAGIQLRVTRGIKPGVWGGQGGWNRRTQLMELGRRPELSEARHTQRKKPTLVVTLGYYGFSVEVKQE